MKLFTFFFIKVLRKLFSLISYIYENLFYNFFYSNPKLNSYFPPKRYLLCEIDNYDDIAKNYRELFPNKIQDKITQADLICQHIFDLLGSGPKKLSLEGEGYQSIDWHTDFKSNFRWNPKTFYRSIKFGHAKGVDIKIPWELSRFQHLYILGQTYILTKNEKYAKEFIHQITDWIKNNPIGFGVNWRCTMDVAIRAINWLTAMEYFTERGLLSDCFLKKFYISIYEHGKFIQKHLEKTINFTSNHYIADIAGLFFIAIYCPFFKESKKWKKFAIKQLFKEIKKQVYSDGCNFEASTSYHRLVLEMFFYSNLLGTRAGINFPENYEKRLKKMFQFSLYCLKPNGTIPQIGDNDNGRFLVFCKRSILDHKYLLFLSSIYFRDSKFKLSGFDFDEEAFWIFGKIGKEIYDNLPFRKKPIASKAFSNAGWYIIRYNKNYCFISCGPNGQNRKGGHAHNDKLSFELVTDNQDIIVDPGTFLYTSRTDERNKFRSTGYHNIIKFRTLEQNKIHLKKIFVLHDKVKIKNIILQETENNITFRGEIQYSKVIQKREITFTKKSNNWKIVDTFSGPKSLDGKLIFHLYPNLTCKDNNIILKKTKNKIASIEVIGHDIEKGIYDYSPEYGLKSKAEFLQINISNKKLTQNIITYIRILQ